MEWTESPKAPEPERIESVLCVYSLRVCRAEPHDPTLEAKAPAAIRSLERHEEFGRSVSATLPLSAVFV